MPYKYRGDIAMADLPIEATGKTLEELFISAAQATEEAMVKTSGIKARITKNVKITADSLDELLYDWLENLVFYKDAQSLFFSKFKIKIEKTKTGYKLTGKISGEKRDPKRHVFGTDVKAVTWHMLEVKKTKTGWKAQVIEDI